MRLLLLVLLCAAPAGALDWTPIAGVRALGGLHNFRGQRGVLSGNADAVFAPAIRYDETWAFLPSARSAFEGTKRVADVLGTATPAEQRMEHRVAFRAVRADPASPWRWKPGLSYKLSYLKETKDETWGRGLFDERLWTVGVEAERLLRDPHGLRLSLDWFDAAYPNYTSLESQTAGRFGGGLARELAGDRVLDRNGARVAASVDAPLGERVRAEAGWSTVWSRYGRQPIVNEGGTLDGRNREDFLTSFNATARMPREWNADLRLLASLTAGAAFQSSSQNGYDASRGKFLGKFYDFREVSLTPSARLLVGPERRRVIADLSVGWRRRTYQNRPAQDAAGAYSGGALSTTELTLSGTLTYPVAPRFSLVFTLERASARSNQRFERYYRYAYEATSALAGFRWDW
ncbi:MAG: hypothetical protein M0D55_04915 [Elusimicrobiota bacterium]|nr:MAG: hypothetical protein M0D55_04915 [Elusimicrobiota bacterium]